MRKKHNDIIKEQVKKADAIIVRLPSIPGQKAIAYAKKYKKPYAVEAVGDIFTALWYYGTPLAKIMAPIRTFKLKKDIFFAKYVLYVSRKFLQERYPTKGYQMGCPDVVLREPDEAVLEKRIKKIGDMNEEITLGLIGSLDVSYRGHEVLIKVMRELRNRNINTKVVFLGHGNRDRWRKIAEEMGVGQNVFFSGSLPSGEPVMQWIDDIDILVMPTKQETLGRAIIEAMSRGCPVIGSSETAISEQIGSDCICKSDDFIKIADVIEKMYNDREYMKYCAQENFYRSFKYTDKQTDKIRNDFFNYFFEKELNLK